MNELLIIAMVAGAVVLAIVAYRFGQRLQPSARGLKPYYRRLGELAPTDACPCRTGQSRNLTYADCCRPRDVNALNDEVREFVMTRWARQSGGRSRAQPIKNRLEDYPIPELTVPEWVSDPDQFTFPIDEETLREWSPMPKSEGEILGDTGDAIPL